MSFTNVVRKRTLNDLKVIKEINSKIEELKKCKDMYSDAYFNEKMKKLTDEKDRVILEGKTTVGKLADEYKKSVHDEFTPKGEELTPDAALFSSAVNLSRTQLEDLADKYKGNNTMLQMIYEYAGSRNITLNRHIVTESEKAKLANTMVGYYNSVMQRPEYSDIWEDDNHFASVFEAAE